MFIFNGDNKQTEVKRGSEVVGRYFYDGEGKRIKKQRYAGGALAEETVFVYSSGKLVAEYSNQVSQTPTVAYTTTDHLGSPRIITDQYGQVKSRRDFMPFGEDIFENVGAARTAALNYSNGPDDLRQKFTGYEKDDETGLDFAEARMYENRFGRFTTVDPKTASGKSPDPQTFNRYVYVGNNPTNLNDPTGLDWYRKRNGDYWTYQYSSDNKVFGDGSKVDGWDSVDFGGRFNPFLKVDGICIDGSCNNTRYLGRYGGSMTPEEYERRGSLASAQIGYCQIDPKCLGVRDPEMRRAAAAVIGGTTGAVWNAAAGTYNLGISGSNYFGGTRFSYLPEFTPEDNGQELFYYGTNAAMVGRAGFSFLRGAMNYRSLNGISQLRPNGSVNTLLDGGQLGQNARTLVTTESHLKDLSKVFSSYKGNLNLTSSSYWKHVLPHRHIYQLPSAPSKLNSNWRKTFQSLGASERKVFRWQPLEF